MIGEAWGAIAGDKSQILASRREIRGREHFAIAAQPLDCMWAVSSGAGAVPERGIGAAETKERVLGAIQRDIVGLHLECENGDIRIDEEVKVDMGDRKLVRRFARSEGNASAANVV